MRVFIKLNVQNGGQRYFRVVSDTPILDSTGAVARVRVWEKPDERYLTVITESSKHYAGVAFRLNRSFNDAMVVYRDWRVTGQPLGPQVRADLEGFIDALKAQVDSPNEEEVVE